MDMKVVHILTTDPAGIDYGTKSVWRTLLPGKAVGKQQNLTKHRLMLLLHMGQGCDMLLRDQHEMNRRYRIDIMKSQDFFVLVNLAAGNLAPDDLAEDAVFSGHLNSIPIWQ